MDKPNGLDRKSLQTQLENYKLIADVNAELFDANSCTKEGFLGELELAQRYMDEAHQWELLGDQTKSHETLCNANITIAKAGAVIKHLLYQDPFLDDSNFQQGQISM